MLRSSRREYYYISFLAIASVIFLVNYSANITTPSKPNEDVKKTIDTYSFQQDLSSVPFPPSFSSTGNLFLWSGHVVLERRATYIIALHERDDKMIKEEFKSLYKKEHIKNMNLVCVYPDGTKVESTYGELDIWWGEFSWFIECKLPVNAEEFYREHEYLHFVLQDGDTGTNLAQFNSTPAFPLLKGEKKRFNMMMCGPPTYTTLAPWTEEWFEYHREIGFEHFAVHPCKTDYDINEIPIIQKYVKENVAHVVEFCPKELQDKKRYFQLYLYLDCIYRYMDHTEWIAMIDYDELIFPVKDVSLVPILKDYGKRNAAALWLAPLQHGPCHPRKYNYTTDKLLLEQFVTRCTKIPYKPPYPYKMIYRTRYAWIPQVHNLQEGTFRVEPDAFKDVRLNHYPCAFKARGFPGGYEEVVEDTVISERYAKTIRSRLTNLPYKL